MSEATCCICGQSLRDAFDATLLGDTQVTFQRCTACGTLQLPNPDWLDRAYARRWVPDPDTGALMRALAVHRVLRRVRAARALRSHHRSLDFGSGRGTLVRLLRDEGQDAWGYEPYGEANFAEAFCSKELPPGQFDLVTVIEVIEHTADPVAVLQRLRDLLSPTGLLLLTTELYDHTRHPDPRTWPYLSLEAGQHVTLFTREGLWQAVRAADLDWFTSVDFVGVNCIHLLARSGQSPGTIKRAAIRALHTLGERRQRKDWRI
jgi:SAM-dependent methyltransferase